VLGKIRKIETSNSAEEAGSGTGESTRADGEDEREGDWEAAICDSRNGGCGESVDASGASDDIDGRSQQGLL